MNPTPQLALDLLQPLQPTLANYVPGRNAEALAAVQALAEGRGERFLYLFGAAGSGRTHLLRAVAALGPSRWLDAESGPVAFDPAVRVYVDDSLYAKPSRGPGWTGSYQPSVVRPVRPVSISFRRASGEA